MKDASTIVRPDGQTGSADSGRSLTPQPGSHPLQTEQRSGSVQVLRLTRSAERLDRVEQDLIRQISHRFEIDAGTKRLLTELRVTTNRLRGHIAAMERDIEAVTESVPTPGDSD